MNLKPQTIPFRIDPITKKKCLVFVPRMLVQRHNSTWQEFNKLLSLTAVSNMLCPSWNKTVVLCLCPNIIGLIWCAGQVSIMIMWCAGHLFSITFLQIKESVKQGRKFINRNITNQILYVINMLDLCISRQRRSINITKQIQFPSHAGLMYI